MLFCNESNNILFYYLHSCLCTEPGDVRLVGGSSNCTGRLKMKHQREWRPVHGSDWTLKSSSVVCRQLDCGSVVSTQRSSSSRQYVWRMRSSCDGSESSLRECGTMNSLNSYDHLEVICSGITQRQYSAQCVIDPSLCVHMRVCVPV